MTSLYDATTKLSFWQRVAILSFITLIYIITLRIFYAVTGYIGPALAILQIATAGWLFGKWAGFLSGILMIPLFIWLYGRQRFNHYGRTRSGDF